MSAGKSGQQKMAENITNQRGSQMQSDLGQQSSLTGAAQGTLGQFEGPLQSSPFYKSLLNSGIEGTSQAYDNARSNMRAKANMAGFGYNQPVEQGAESQLGAQEAKSMAEVPMQATLESVQPAMQAASQSGQMGMGYGNQALGFGNQQLGANEQAAQLQQQRNQQNSQMWQTLAQVAAGAAMGA